MVVKPTLQQQFEFAMGQEVWLLDGNNKAITSTVVGRTLDEDEETISVRYMIDEIGHKSEGQLFGSAAELLNSVFSEKPGIVNFATKGDKLTISDNQKYLFDLCGRFIDENKIKGDKFISLKGMNAELLMTNICELIGYYEGDLDE